MLAVLAATVALVGVAVDIDALAVAPASRPILRVVPPGRALEARADTRIHRDAPDTTEWSTSKVKQTMLISLQS